MRPVVTPDQMRRIDRAASEPIGVLVERAGWAVAVAAREMLGGTYGRRVTVLAGQGNNGADGRAAARVLERWGARCRIVRVDAMPAILEHPGDLVIDACFGTGFRGSFSAPAVGNAPVLAVDIPSGIDGLTGAVSGQPLKATRTITFVAPKPGLLLSPGASLVGALTVVDVGLPSSAPGETTTRFWVEPSEGVALWPPRPQVAHKWQSAVWVIGGSAGMHGAVRLAVAGAVRAGAGYVRLSTPDSIDRGAPASVGMVEAVEHPLGPRWADEVLADAGRFGALVIGPGLSIDGQTMQQTSEVVRRWPGKLVVDAGALSALAPWADDPTSLLGSRALPAVLTPHDGEFSRLGGSLIDRVAGVEELSRRLASVVLLKGPTTLVAEPGGVTWFCTSGSERLATAGSGDVLAGVIGAALARGLEPGMAAAAAADVHGRAAAGGHAVGLAAGDLPELVAQVLSRRGHRPTVSP